MMILLDVLVVAAVAVSMEFVAWFLHKYVMHGFLWILHEDHHRPTHKGLQKNDLFAAFFSLASFVLIGAGLLGRLQVLTFAGLGMALYGVGYFLFHDVMFHRRIPGVRIKSGHWYLRRIVRAHSTHHQHSGKGQGVSFGFLYAGKAYDEEQAS